jgi:hypothetical protein
MKEQVEPEIIRLMTIDDHQRLKDIISNNPGIKIHNTIESQIDDLIKSRNPSRAIDSYFLESEKLALIGDKSTDEYGSWVYYPWSNQLVHVLDESEFVELRTNRNLYKITQVEQQLLSTKKIAIIGLSVGQSVALALAMERICSTLIIADFDTIDLSNLNRIRTGIHNLGIPKTTVVAREIKEIDPYFDIKIFSQGATKDNIDEILHINGTKVDILIDECDSLVMKLFMRAKAKSYGIPVVMDTSDRGQIDIERFDLDNRRPILHGTVEDIDLQNVDLNKPETRMMILSRLVDLENASPRALQSLGEIGKTLNTWPQLASSVLLGGAVTADLCRRILLGETKSSGRYYVELDKLVP